MNLTGKAKEDFLKWKVNNRKLSTIEILDFNHLSVVSQYAIIVEWFSTKNYHNYNLWDYCFSNAYWNRGMKEYIESVKYAIIKANELYNENIRTD